MVDISDTIRLKQLTFQTDDRTLSKILTKIADSGINIRGFMQFRIESKLLSVNLIPGITDQPQETSMLKGVSKILKKLGVNYRKRIVLAVLLPDIPGQLARIERLLYCKVKIFSTYRDRSLRNVYDTNDIDTTERILNNASRMKEC